MNLESELNNELSEAKFDSNFTHIPYSEKILRSYTELMDTDPNKIIKWWWKEWDNLLWWIYWWKVYVIGASTGTGKSTFVNQICNNISNQWYRVVKYSLEDRLEDIWKEEIFYMINRLRKKDSKKWYWWIDFINWNLNKEEEFWIYLDKACGILVDKNNLIELDKTQQVSIDDLIKLMEKECLKGTRVFSIDHLHYFDMSGKDRHDLIIQWVMHRINELARKHNVAVFLVAHYRKGNNEDEPSMDEFKDGSAIKHVANVVIQITRDDDDWLSIFHITKLRWPIKKKVLTTTFNLETFEYDFTKIKEAQDDYF